MNASQYIVCRETRARKEGMWIGLITGLFSTLVVALVAGATIDYWRTRSFDKRVKSAIADAESKLAICNANLARFKAVSDLADVIDATRGGREQ